MERPAALNVQIPHSLPTDILIDVSDMAADDSLANPVRNKIAVPALDKAHVWVNKSKPEADVVVFYFVETAFASFWIFFCYWDFPFQDVEVRQGFQIFSQAVRFDLQGPRNILFPAAIARMMEK